MRFLHAYSAALRIDPGRIGTWGSSAGGHLVSLLGLAGPAAGFDVGHYAGQSSRVEAVVDMFGPSDLTDTGDYSRFGRFIVAAEFGSASRQTRLAASPVTYVASGSPPFLILQGADDPLIPAHHSQDFATRLKATGAPVTFVLVQHTGHSMSSPNERPSVAEVERMVVDFLVASLHPGT